MLLVTNKNIRFLLSIIMENNSILLNMFPNNTNFNFVFKDYKILDHTFL